MVGDPMTPRALTSAENALFDALERDDPTFRKGLYRDGIPSPATYLRQDVRVVFVFRDPNFGGRPRPHDMRDEIRDAQFRPLKADGSREQRRPTCWWNWKAGMFAHATAAALDDEPWRAAFARFQKRDWNHEVVNRFGYVQIKKLAGGGVANSRQIRDHAERHAAVLTRQFDLYKPNLVIGCGTPPASPAELLAQYVFTGGTPGTTGTSKAKCWMFGTSSSPATLLQLWHPARRGSKAELYEDVWKSVRDVVTG